MFNAFTARPTNGGIARVLLSTIDIYASGTEVYEPVIAICDTGDTGATGTSITSEVVKKLNISPTGKTLVSTVNGTVQQNTYTIDIQLPSQVFIKGIVATEVQELSGEANALIGMDIITLGDFSITNHIGNTCMSFRIPSLHEIDYATSPNFGVVKIENINHKNEKKVGRNDPCPCGSNIKYKKCHGINRAEQNN